MGPGGTVHVKALDRKYAVREKKTFLAIRHTSQKRLSPVPNRATSQNSCES